MTPEGTAAAILLAIIIGARLLFGKLFVNRSDSRKLHQTVKGYILTTLGSLTVIILGFTLRYWGLEVGTAQSILLGLLLLLGGYYAFLEWRYIRESRRHIATLLTTVVAVAAVGVYVWMLPVA
ncbi:DUF4181 domain-containing protein [Saccharibacillus sacchari]|uniref:DUF4181 domain-containing protein n=1 Tax=Saccharibacillus sacchari TaxID=456493 RepID=A0ACC6PJU0_9BACL